MSTTDDTNATRRGSGSNDPLGQASEARWYCLDRDGVAMLCKDEADARAQVIENDDCWPGRAPHRAVVLIEANAADAHIPMARLIELETAEHERDILRRWKSTHAPRMGAMEGLLHAAQAKAEAGREAVATLDSERLANARLTAELEDAQRQRELVFAELLKEQTEHARARYALRELMQALDAGGSLSIAEAMTAADAVLAPNASLSRPQQAE